jgi:hypothetical protein
MTNQEAFDVVAVHLIRQGKQSRDPAFATDYRPEGLCRYRAPDGSKCAVGALIPDDRYEANMEGTFPTDIAERLPDVFGGLDLEMLEHLQMVHDQDDPDEWRSSLKWFASVEQPWGLSTAVLDAEPLGPAERV